MKILTISNPFNSPVYYLEQTQTTMEAIREIPGLRSGSVLLAGYQLRGKGRVPGRVWDGDKDKNIYFSLFLNKNQLKFSLTSLSARTAFAAASFLSVKYGIDSKVKWPNDILVNNKKISGILIELRGENVIIGCGINCLQRTFPESSGNATSISLESGSTDIPELSLEKLLPFLYDEFMNVQPLSERQNRIFRYNKELTIKTGHPESGEKITGIVRGFNENGSLLLETSKGRESVYSGEVLKDF